MGKRDRRRIRQAGRAPRHRVAPTANTKTTTRTTRDSPCPQTRTSTPRNISNPAHTHPKQRNNDAQHSRRRPHPPEHQPDRLTARSGLGLVPLRSNVLRPLRRPLSDPAALSPQLGRPRLRRSLPTSRPPSLSSFFGGELTRVRRRRGYVDSIVVVGVFWGA